MPEQHFVMRNGRQFGPFTTRELKQLAVSRQLKPTDLVWLEKTSKWVPAADIHGLFKKRTTAEILPAIPIGEPKSQHLAKVAPFQADWLTRSLATLKNQSGLTMGLSVAGLTLSFCGLFCPWYAVSASSASNVFGKASLASTVSGWYTLPGLLVLPMIVMSGVFCFLRMPWARWAGVGCAGGILLMGIWGLVYLPRGQADINYRYQGMRSQGSARAGSSWGPWVTIAGAAVFALAQATGLPTWPQIPRRGSSRPASQLPSRYQQWRMRQRRRSVLIVSLIVLGGVVLAGVTFWNAVPILPGQWRRMTRDEFKKKLDEIKEQGRVEPPVFLMFDRAKFIATFGEPQDDMEWVRGDRRWRYECADGSIILRVSLMGNKIIVSELSSASF
ncbi:MAG: hypothetical protein KatS3mg105_3226 [Gemmatales bacterium]|nr:MAG: hypothetical protein KatS3mg105_3226 [Gemmatales bacterium]